PPPILSAFFLPARRTGNQRTANGSTPCDGTPRPFPRNRLSSPCRSTSPAVQTNSPPVHGHASLAALHLFPRPPSLSLSALQSTARTILVPMPVHLSPSPPLPMPHRIHEPRARARTTPRLAPAAWRSRHSASVRSKTS